MVFSLRLTTALLLAATSALAEWDPIHRLTETEANSNLPGIGDGFAVHSPYIHVLHSDRNNANEDKLFYRRSPTAGGTWDETFEVEEQSLAFTFSIAADNAGNVHIINARLPDGQLWYRRSTDNGATWLDAVQIAGHAEFPILLTNGQQNVYVFDPGLGYANLWMLKSTDGGASWSNAVYLTSSSSFDGFTGTASDNNHIYLSWSAGNQGRSFVYVKRSTDNGENWGDDRRAVGVEGSGARGIWTDGIDHVYLSYDVFGANQNFRRSTNAGDTWSSGKTLPALLRDAVCDRNRSVHGVSVVESDRIYYLGSEHRGDYWTDTIRISTLDPGIRTKPHIELGGDTLHCVWNSRSTGKVQVVYRRHPGLPIGVNENPGPAEPRRAFELRPNPVRATVELKGDSPVALFDESGARVADLKPGANDVAYLPRGVYFARGSKTESPTKLVKLQ